MNTDTILSIRKQNRLVLFLAILILMLNLFLPVVSIKTDVDAEKYQYLNVEAMRESYDESLNSLSKDITQINLFLWIVTIAGFISFLGLIIKLSEKAKRMSNIFIASGCITLVFSSISFIWTIKTLLRINNIEEVFPSFIYFNLLLLLILTIITISFTLKIVKALVNDLKKMKKVKNKISDEKEIKEIKKIKKADPKEELEKPVKKPIKFKMDDWENKRPKTVEFSEKNNTESDVSEKTNISEKPKIEEMQEIPEIKQESEDIPVEKQTEEISSVEDPFLQEYKRPVESKEEEKDVKISDDSFEKALDSAIKKKKDVTKQKPKSSQPPKKPEKKSIAGSKDELKKEISKEIGKTKKSVLEKFNVKCPECDSVFEAEKQPAGITRIKCPKCGKEGVIK